LYIAGNLAYSGVNPVCRLIFDLFGGKTAMENKKEKAEKR